MYLDRNYDAILFESQDGDKYWAEDGANYIEGAGTVVLNCLDSDGEETSTSFTKMEALGLAIELARAAGAHEIDLAELEYKLNWNKLVSLIENFPSEERGNLNLLSYKLFGMGILDGRMTVELVEAVIKMRQEEQESWKN